MPYVDSETRADKVAHCIHSDTCWHWHLPCAVHRIEILQAQNQELRDTWQLAWNALATVEKQRDEALRQHGQLRDLESRTHDTLCTTSRYATDLEKERNEARQWAQRLYWTLRENGGVCPKCGDVLDTITGECGPVSCCRTCSKVYS